jgi:alkaline phosphatase D
LFFWPGSEAEIQGIRPTYYKKYDQKISNEARVNQVVEWLKLPKEVRPHFITLYFSDVDSAGHEYGTNSSELQNSVKDIDSQLQKLEESLSSLNLPVNLIILSDHGMVDLDKNKIIYVDELADLSSAQVLETGPQMFLYGKNLDSVYEKLKKQEKHFAVYKRSQVPKKFHYSANARIGDLLLLAQMPYSLGTERDKFKIPMGSHGYNARNMKR